MVPKNSEFDINSDNFLVVEYEDFEDLKKYIKITIKILILFFFHGWIKFQ